MSTNTNFYSHKINMYVGSSNILCFSAYIAIDQPENYVIKKVEGLGEDAISKSLFDDIISGNFKSTYLDNNMQKMIISLNEGSAFANINKYISLQEQGYFSSKMDLIALPRVDSIGFRFDGSPYNLKYSIPRKEASKFEEIANEAIKIIEVETANDEFYASEPVAASTMIKFSTERLDPRLNDVISKLSHDTMNSSVDLEYIKNQPGGILYKKLIKSFRTINNIKDLDTFEVVINDIHYPINFRFVKNAQEQIFSKNSIDILGTKSGSEYIDNDTILSVKINTMDGVVYLHIPAHQENMIKDAESVPLNSQTQRMKSKGIPKGECTYDCIELIVITS